MLNFTHEGKDDGLHIVRLHTGERRKLTQEQFEELKAGGEIPSYDAVPTIDLGPGLHPTAQNASVDTVATPPEEPKPKKPKAEKPDPSKEGGS